VNNRNHEGSRHGGAPVVSCENVTFSYFDSGSPALGEISFEVRAGEYVGVVGPNGGGKSTLLRLMNGLLRADSGDVRVAGFDPAAEPFEVRKRVGMLFQNPENGLVALAGLLALDPEVLLLDEPTSMLDAAGRRGVLERLEALRGARTVVHVTHHLDELLDADRVLVLGAGRLVADVSPERLVSDPDLLRDNRLVLPTALRLAAELGLGPAKLRTPEDLAEAIVEKSGARAR